MLIFHLIQGSIAFYKSRSNLQEQNARRPPYIKEIFVCRNFKNISYNHYINTTKKKYKISTCKYSKIECKQIIFIKIRGLIINFKIKLFIIYCFKSYNQAVTYTMDRRLIFFQ